MLLKILLALVLVGVVLAAVVALQSPNFRVARQTVIPVSPAVVFAQVSDLQKWQAWSPWAKLDPNAKVTFDGPTAQVGSSFTWSGNDQIGEGTMTIIESHPVDLVRFRLDFRKPFAGTNEATFTLAASNGGTDVQWAMTGQKNFLMKAIGLFMNCDKMLGPQFEEGLANLKAVSEAAAKSSAPQP